LERHHPSAIAHFLVAPLDACEIAAYRIEVPGIEPGREYYPGRDTDERKCRSKTKGDQRSASHAYSLQNRAVAV
jgi:hypothetical protein